LGPRKSVSKSSSKWYRSNRMQEMTLGVADEGKQLSGWTFAGNTLSGGKGKWGAEPGRSLHNIDDGKETGDAPLTEKEEAQGSEGGPEKATSNGRKARMAAEKGDD